MAEKNNKKESKDPAYNYIKPTFKGSDPAYKYIKSESKDNDPAFKYINNTNNSFVDKFKRNFKANLKKEDQDTLKQKNITNNIDPAYKYIKQSDKAYEYIEKTKQNNNENIEAQKRLLGSIKNIGKAIKGKENKSSYSWKSQLNWDEKEFLNKNPGPNFENYESFLIRYKKHKKIPKLYPEKFTKKFLEPAEEALKRISDWQKELKEPEEKNFLFRHPGPKYEDLDSFKRRFNSYKLKKIKEQKIENKTESKKIKSIDQIKIKVTKTNKPDLNEIKENTQTILTCFYCSSPMNNVDMFCGECGKPKKINKVVIDKVKPNLDKKVKKKNKKDNLNNLPIKTLENLKSLFDDDLIKKNEYDLLRKSILKISNKIEEKSKISSNIKKIESIERDKLIELKNLFDNNLIETDEYEALRKDLLKI